MNSDDPDCVQPAGAWRLASKASGSDNMNATMKSPSTVPVGLFTVREMAAFDAPAPGVVATVEFRYETATSQYPLTKAKTYHFAAVEL